MSIGSVPKPVYICTNVEPHRSKPRFSGPYSQRPALGSRSCTLGRSRPVRRSLIAHASTSVRNGIISHQTPLLIESRTTQQARRQPSCGHPKLSNNAPSQFPMPSESRCRGLRIIDELKPSVDLPKLPARNGAPDHSWNERIPKHNCS